MSNGLCPQNKKAVPMVQRSIAAASIGATYSLVTSIFSAPVVSLIIYSSLDQTVQLSLDGVSDFIPIPAGGTLVLDEKANDVVINSASGIWVKEIGNPTTGSLYVGGFSL